MKDRPHLVVALIQSKNRPHWTTLLACRGGNLPRLFLDLRMGSPGASRRRALQSQSLLRKWAEACGGREILRKDVKMPRMRNLYRHERDAAASFGIASVTVGEGNDIFGVSSDFLVDFGRHYLVRYCGEEIEMASQEEVESISAGCFSHCKSVLQVRFPAGCQVLILGESAFCFEAFPEMTPRGTEFRPSLSVHGPDAFSVCAVASEGLRIGRLSPVGRKRAGRFRRV
jgi:hypothetical protein